MEKWEKISENDIYKNHIFTLKNYSCHNGKKQVNHDFKIIETFDWINIVPVTEDGKIIMVHQHRLGTDEITIETPGGLCDPGENHLKTAERELSEETGYKAGQFTVLAELRNNPAIMNNNIYYYLAEGCIKTGNQSLDAAEDIELSEHSLDEIQTMINDGTINHSIVVLALKLYFEKVRL